MDNVTGGVQRDVSLNPGPFDRCCPLWHLPGRNAPAWNSKTAAKNASVI